MGLFLVFFKSKLTQSLNAILSAYCSASAQPPLSLLSACEGSPALPSAIPCVCGKHWRCSPLALPSGGVGGRGALLPAAAGQASLLSWAGCTGLPAAGQEDLCAAYWPGWEVDTPAWREQLPPAVAKDAVLQQHVVEMLQWGQGSVVSSWETPLTNSFKPFSLCDVRIRRHCTTTRDF